MREVAAAFAQATGFEAEFIRLSKDQVNPNFPPDLRVEMDECLAYLNEFGYEGRDDATVVHPKDVSSER
jgi:hypothetical protein